MPRSKVIDSENCAIAALEVLKNGLDGSSSHVFEVQYRYFDDENPALNVSGVLRKTGTR